MTLKLKSEYKFADLAAEAARRRFSTENSRLEGKDVDYAVSSYLRQPLSTTPALVTGQPFDSRRDTEFVKDCKFITALNNLELSAIGQEVNSFRYFNESSLGSLEQELSGLESAIEEQEIKQKELYTTVHANSFARQEDFGLSSDNRQWMADFKTRSSFLPSQVISPVANTGCMLPVVYDQQIFPKKIEVDFARTTSGDGLVKFADANNLISNRVFDFAVVRSEESGTADPAVCALAIDFGRVVKLNGLLFAAAAAGLLQVTVIEFLSPSGWVALDFEQIPVDNEFRLIFSAIETEHLYLEVKTSTVVYRGPVQINDGVKRSINEVLAGLNWDARLTTVEEIVEGRVLDLSIRKLQFYLTEYNHKGVFRSQPVKVNLPISCKLTDLALNVSDGFLQPEYGTNFTFGDDNHLVEYYLGGSFDDYSGFMAPLPTSVNEEESLVFVGDTARCRFMPDLLLGVPSKRVLSIDDLIVVALDHEYVVGDQLMIGRKGVSVTSVINSSSFTISTFLGQVTESTTPYLYARKLRDFNYYLTFAVSADGVSKKIGTDYRLSLDSGETWHSSMNTLIPAWFSRYDRFVAGDMYIRLTKPPQDRQYLINYSVCPTQALTADRQLYLENGKVIFGRILSLQRGQLTTILVLRSTSYNVYSTPVVVKYCLKVRENVT